MNTVTYEQLAGKVYRKLSDVAQKSYSEDTVFDGLIGAHEAILPWMPNFAMVTLTSGSPGMEANQLLLPDDLYQIDAVQLVESGVFLTRAVFGDGTTRNAGYEETPLDWTEYPSGVLNLSAELDTGALVRLYYRAYWPRPDAVDSTFAIRVPRIAHMGMVFYACSSCLDSKSVGSGGIRQFNTKTDSGTPEDNPLQAMSDWFLRRFMQEMKLMPSFTKVGS